MEIAEVMRRRVLGGVASGTLRRNDRLPSARELASEFDVDPRLVLSSYRVLAREGLVDIRRRSGIYVAGTTGSVTLANITATANPGTYGDGAYIDNTWGTGNVTLTGDTTFGGSGTSEATISSPAIFSSMILRSPSRYSSV